MPTKYQVGQPYSPTKKHWPEGVDYNYRAGQHELSIFMRTPSAGEIQSIETGPARFALAIIGDIIFFCYRFGSGPWGDCGFSIHLVPEEKRRLPPPPASNTERALLTTMLIDAETGILKVIRATTFSPRFTQRLHKAITEQAGKAFPPNYDAQGEAVYRRYTSAELAKNMAQARCRGGE